MTFISWRRRLKRGEALEMTPELLRRLRLTVHAELTGVVLMLLAAALMSRGVGYFG